MPPAPALHSERGGPVSVHLRRMRLQQGLTLDQLAQAAGLTRSYLSKVERGLNAPSITVGLQLAQALGVTVEQLFERGAAQGAVTITRARERRAGEAAQLVSGPIDGGRLSAFVLQPARVRMRNPAGHHRGEELVYVLSGAVELELPDLCERLEAGDSAHFDSSIPHRITSVGEVEARLLAVIAPFAEARAAVADGAAAQPTRMRAARTTGPQSARSRRSSAR